MSDREKILKDIDVVRHQLAQKIMSCHDAGLERQADQYADWDQLMIECSQHIRSDAPCTREPATERRGWPKKGDKMRFLGRNGHDYQLEAAKKVFNIEAVYEVERFDLGDWKSYIRFVGIDGEFNHVMFDWADAAPPVRSAASAVEPADTREALSADLGRVQCELDAAVLRVADLEDALKFYRGAWQYKPGPTGLGLEWSPKEDLLDDCGNRAKDALARNEREGGAT